MHYQIYVRHITTRGQNVYQLLGDTWNTLVDNIGLETGTTCVLTKSGNKSFWFDAFNDDGSMITQPVSKGAANLRKTQLKLDFFEQSKYEFKLFRNLTSQDCLIILIGKL